MLERLEQSNSVSICSQSLYISYALGYKASLYTPEVVHYLHGYRQNGLNLDIM